MPTRQEIENLKAGWKKDPCWDIADTEGFEEHKDELQKFQDHWEREWKDREQGRKEGLCVVYDINMALLDYIEALERRIERLENKE